MRESKYHGKRLPWFGVTAEMVIGQGVTWDPFSFCLLT